MFHSDGCATAYPNFAVGDNRQTIQGDCLGLQVGLRSPLSGLFKMLQDDQRIASFWALGSRYSRVRDWTFVGAVLETSGPVLVTPRRRGRGCRFRSLSPHTPCNPIATGTWTNHLKGLTGGPRTAGNELDTEFLCGCIWDGHWDLLQTVIGPGRTVRASETALGRDP